MPIPKSKVAHAANYMHSHGECVGYGVMAAYEVANGHGALVFVAAFLFVCHVAGVYAWFVPEGKAAA